MSEKITIADIKSALNDETFRATLPPELNEDVAKYLQNPNCGCNVKNYQRMLTIGNEQFAKYFPNKNVVKALEHYAQQPPAPPQPTKEITATIPVMKTRHVVFNCHVDELQSKLDQLSNLETRTNVTISRSGDMVTAVATITSFH